jgi:hypothetical protein
MCSAYACHHKHKPCNPVTDLSSKFSQVGTWAQSSQTEGFLSSKISMGTWAQSSLKMGNWSQKLSNGWVLWAQSSQMGTSAQSSQWVSELKELSGYPTLSAQFENLFNQLDFIFSFYNKMWETIVQSLQHTTHDAFQFASAKPCILVCTLSQQKNSKELWQTSKYKRHRFSF